MQVINAFFEDSIKYKADSNGLICNIDDREKELIDLIGISDYCASIKEKIIFAFSIYECEVCKGISLSDYLYDVNVADSHNKDIHDMLMNIIEKNSFEESGSSCNTEQINISLGIVSGAVHDINSYLQGRQSLLKNKKKVEEYAEFMKSCFPNSIFAEDILQGMKGISRFDDVCGVITNALSVLDRDAIELYKDYRSNLESAMKILTARIADCSKDHNHREKLVFEFRYEDDKNQVKYKEIACEPHLKLIRRDSNLRIYFYWADKDVGNDEKVLVGRIGSHPY